MVCSFGITANAQLGKPTTSVKDTFYISKVFYNGTELNRADWPDTTIIEDALNVYVAKYVYIKGKLKSNYGDKLIYDALCNGKTCTLTIKNYYGREYTIDDYRFVVGQKEEPQVNYNALFKGKRESGGSFALSGRTIVSLPTPRYNGNVQGKVVVKIWVDRNGNVTKTEAPQKGSTASNPTLVNAAIEAARKAKFNAVPNAPEEQTGTLTYVFRMD